MEIGSNFDLDLNSLTVVKNNLFNYLKDYNCSYFDSGRSAIKSIVVPKGKVLLPSFICDSVIDCFNKKEIVFYKVDSNFNIDYDDLASKIKGVKTIFIMHYFGCLQPKTILNKIAKLAKERKITIIEDTTHSILSKKSTIGDYMVCSIRKWFPIARGGVLYSKKELKNRKYKVDTNNAQIYAMILKHKYLNGESINKKEFREIFINCEKELDNKKEILEMSDLSKFIIACCDINIIKNKRIENYLSLNKKIKYKSVNSIKNGECPFAYVIRIEDRDKLRKYLTENSIYCPIHWPNCSFNELSIPIDNRYGKKEIDYIIKVLKNYR